MVFDVSLKACIGSLLRLLEMMFSRNFVSLQPFTLRDSVLVLVWCGVRIWKRSLSRSILVSCSIKRVCTEAHFLVCSIHS